MIFTSRGTPMMRSSWPAPKEIRTPLIKVRFIFSILLHLPFLSKLTLYRTIGNYFKIRAYRNSSTFMFSSIAIINNVFSIINIWADDLFYFYLFMQFIQTFLRSIKQFLNGSRSVGRSMKGVSVLINMSVLCISYWVK